VAYQYYVSLLEIIQSVFKEHKIVEIDCSKIIYGGGGLHCITMQQPDINLNL